MKVSFSTGANRDVKEILEHYSREAGPEVSMDFHSELSSVIERIKQWPGSFPFVRAELRRALMDRFPFQVVYKVVHPEEIRILAIRHHRRHPDFGLDR